MKLITNFLSIQSQLKVLHWQTKSYAEHKAFGKLYDALDGLFDTFIEVYMGKYGTILAKEEFASRHDHLACLLEQHAQHVLADAAEDRHALQKVNLCCQHHVPPPLTGSPSVGR